MDSEQVQNQSNVRSDYSERKSVNRAGTHRRRYLVNFLIVMLSIGACTSLNSICAELPLLSMQAPEGLALSANLAIVIVLAYIPPALYALFYKSASKFKISNEFAWISSIFVLGTSAMGALAFFHHITTAINAVDYSVVMISLGFILALLAGSRQILLLPYLRHFKEADLASFFVGEGLSGLIPSVVALIQGAGGEPVCLNNTTNTTDPSVSYVAPPNFSSRTFFLFVLALMVCCTCAFWILEYLRVPNSPVKKNAKFHRDLISTKERISSRKLLYYEIEDTDITVSTQTSSAIAPGKSISKMNRIFLCGLIWLNCLTSHGYLNSVEGYSSRPYGNAAYHLVANLSQLAGTVACGFAFWLPPLGSRAIAVITGLVYVGSAYLTWLATSSPTPPWRDTTHGVVLLVTIWVLVISFVSYSKLAITMIIWQESSETSLQQLNFATLSGSISSAALIFFLVNFTTIFTPYIPCEPQK